MTISELKPSKNEKIEYLMELYKTDNRAIIKVVVDYLDECKFEWEDDNFINYIVNRRKDMNNKLIKTMDEYQKKMYSNKESIEWLKELTKGKRQNDTI